MFEKIINKIKELYKTDEFIPLHAPIFFGNEKKYLNECIDTTFVSYVGKFVELFEKNICEYTGAKYAVATVNGTTALQIALQLAGVSSDNEVITQPLTFVATVNAIKHANSNPVFIDVDIDTAGLSAEKLTDFLKNKTKQVNNKCINISTNKQIKACVPVHTFGFSCRIDEIVEICNKHNIIVIEDSAESLGSFYKNKHTGTFGTAGILSFNGNKTITTGGGGMILTDNEEFAKKAKHLTTTGKIPHKWEFNHDVVAYNYRLTNLNAAIGVAQMENIEKIIEIKRNVAFEYHKFFETENIKYLTEITESKANFWLNCILFDNIKTRDEFLEYSNNNNVMARPAWKLMNELEIFKNCQVENIENSKYFAERLVNIPSSIVL